MSDFKSFLSKASDRLEKNKQPKYAMLHIPSLDEVIKVRSLTQSEVIESTDMEDSLEGDKYVVYLSVVEPNFKELARELKEQGKIKNYTEVCDILQHHERAEVVKEVMKLSGVLGDNKVKLVEHVKN